MSYRVCPLKDSSKSVATPFHKDGKHFADPEQDKKNEESLYGDLPTIYPGFEAEACSSLCCSLICSKYCTNSFIASLSVQS